MTPYQLLEREQQKLQILVDHDLTAEDYFLSGGMHIWLLSIADGIRACQAYCIAAGGTMVILTKGH